MSYAIHPEPSKNEESWDRDDWNTPEWVLLPIRNFAGGKIGLDPCSNHTSIVNAEHILTKEDNSLNHSWADKGLVYINPPYSRKLFISFAKKIIDEAQNGVEIIALVPTNCETAAWQEYLWKANAICFLNRRVRFLKNGMEKGSPAGGSALVYFGVNTKNFELCFKPLGKVVILK